MEQSIAFYREVLGLKFQKRREIVENNAEIAFFKDEKTGMLLELTFWKSKQDWNSGDELDHIAFEVPNLDEAIRAFRKQKVEIAKEPFSLKGSSSRIAFIKDPNGIWLEIIERQ